MSKNKKESFFWTSYSDLMTSLFFVMLVLFILVIVLLRNKMIEFRTIAVDNQQQIDKIKEIENATKNIDSTYFEYRDQYKKHILKINARFDPDEFERKNIIPQSAIKGLIEAGESIKDSIASISSRFPEIQYLLIIEGQASRDRATDQHNYELSYKRAFTLKKIWDKEGINFGNNCEVIISGSGTGGTMRETIEKNNQRFLIHIIPKPGMIEANKKN